MKNLVNWMILVAYCVPILVKCGSIVSNQEFVKEQTEQEEYIEEAEQTKFPNEVVELYSDGEEIDVSEVMIASVSPEELLQGSLILYDRLQIDGWVFEWIIADYYDSDQFLVEEGVLIVSREDNTEDAQVIHR